MDTSTELAARELLFYAQCELAAMIAENDQRKHRGEAMAYVEGHFWALAENTRGAYRNITG